MQHGLPNLCQIYISTACNLQDKPYFTFFGCSGLVLDPQACWTCALHRVADSPAFFSLASMSSPLTFLREKRQHCLIANALRKEQRVILPVCVILTISLQPNSEGEQHMHIQSMPVLRSPEVCQQHLVRDTRRTTTGQQSHSICILHLSVCICDQCQAQPATTPTNLARPVKCRASCLKMLEHALIILLQIVLLNCVGHTFGPTDSQAFERAASLTTVTACRCAVCSSRRGLKCALYPLLFL